METQSEGEILVPPVPDLPFLPNLLLFFNNKFLMDSTSTRYNIQNVEKDTEKSQPPHGKPPILVS